VASLLLLYAIAWLFDEDKGVGKVAFHYFGYLAIYLPPAVMFVVWWRKGLSFWQTTFSGFVWYFFMYVLVCVGLGAGHGLFSVGWERAIRGLGMITLNGIVMCFPIALASSGAFHTIKRRVKREGYEEHVRPGLLAMIGWRDLVEYAVAVGFSIPALLAADHLYAWLVAANPYNRTMPMYFEYSGYPFQLYGVPFGATIGVVLVNWIFYGKSRVRVSAIALGIVSGLGGVMALSMLAVWFWNGSLKGDVINTLIASFLCVMGYRYMAVKRGKGE